MNKTDWMDYFSQQHGTPSGVEAKRKAAPVQKVQPTNCGLSFKNWGVAPSQPKGVAGSWVKKKSTAKRREG